MVELYQLELTFMGASAALSRVNCRQRRVSRARWWFEQMRQVVDHAFDWQPAPSGRPEQIWFTDTRGRVHTTGHPAVGPLNRNGEVNTSVDSSVRQVCE